MLQGHLKKKLEPVLAEVWDSEMVFMTFEYFFEMLMVSYKHGLKGLSDKLTYRIDCLQISRRTSHRVLQDIPIQGKQAGEVKWTLERMRE